MGRMSERGRRNAFSAIVHSCHFLYPDEYCGFALSRLSQPKEASIASVTIRCEDRNTGCGEQETLRQSGACTQT